MLNENERRISELKDRFQKEKEDSIEHERVLSNQRMRNQNERLEEEFNEQKKIIKEQNIEIIYLKEKLEEKQKIIDKFDVQEETVYKNILLPEDELNIKIAPVFTPRVPHSRHATAR